MSLADEEFIEMHGLHGSSITHPPHDPLCVYTIKQLARARGFIVLIECVYCLQLKKGGRFSNHEM